MPGFNDEEITSTLITNDLYELSDFDNDQIVSKSNLLSNDEEQHYNKIDRTQEVSSSSLSQDGMNSSPNDASAVADMDVPDLHQPIEKVAAGSMSPMFHPAMAVHCKYPMATTLQPSFMNYGQSSPYSSPHSSLVNYFSPGETSVLATGFRNSNNNTNCVSQSPFLCNGRYRFLQQRYPRDYQITSQHSPTSCVPHNMITNFSQPMLVKPNFHDQFLSPTPSIGYGQSQLTIGNCSAIASSPNLSRNDSGFSDESSLTDQTIPVNHFSSHPMNACKNEAVNLTNVQLSSSQKSTFDDIEYSTYESSAHEIMYKESPDSPPTNNDLYIKNSPQSLSSLSSHENISQSVRSCDIDNHGSSSPHETYNEDYFSHDKYNIACKPSCSRESSYSDQFINDAHDNDNNEPESRRKRKDKFRRCKSLFQNMPQPDQEKNSDMSAIDKIQDRLNEIFNCKQCSYSTQNKSNFRNHLFIHSEERLFACNLCSYKGKQSAGLRAHLKVHSVDKPFKCPYCCYTCKRKQNLLQHLRTHTKTKPFLCSICTHSAATKQALNKHMYFKHSPESRGNGSSDSVSKTKELASNSLGICEPSSNFDQECRLSDTEDSKAGLLLEEGNLLTESEFVEVKYLDETNLLDDVCDDKEISSDKQITSVNSNTSTLFSCPHCNFSTIRKCAFGNHIKKHTHSYWNCQFCSFSCRLANSFKTHLAKHAKDSKLECVQCPFRTVNPGRFLSHMKTHTTNSCEQDPLSTLNVATSKPSQSSSKTFNVYQCPYCQYDCRVLSFLKLHISNHKDKDFKIFKRSELLNQGLTGKLTSCSSDRGMTPKKRVFKRLPNGRFKSSKDSDGNDEAEPYNRKSLKRYHNQLQSVSCKLRSSKQKYSKDQELNNDVSTDKETSTSFSDSKPAADEIANSTKVEESEFYECSDVDTYHNKRELSTEDADTNDESLYKNGKLNYLGSNFKKYCTKAMNFSATMAEQVNIDSDDVDLSTTVSKKSLLLESLVDGFNPYSEMSKTSDQKNSGLTMGKNNDSANHSELSTALSISDISSSSNNIKLDETSNNYGPTAVINPFNNFCSPRQSNAFNSKDGSETADKIMYSNLSDASINSNSRDPETKCVFEPAPGFSCSKLTIKTGNPKSTVESSCPKLTEHNDAPTYCSKPTENLNCEESLVSEKCHKLIIDSSLSMPINSPSNPEAVESSSNSETGESPSNPEAVESPSNSETGESPSNFETGESPSNFETGELPSNFETGESPSNFETGESPSNSETDESPSNPEAGESPSNPEAGESPSNPEAGESLSNPEAGESLSNPEAGESPSNPEAGESPSNPEAVESPSNPEAVESPSNPEAVESPSNPEAVESPSNPETVESPSNPETVKSPSNPEAIESPSNAETVESPSNPKAVEYPSNPEAVESSSNPDPIIYQSKVKLTDSPVNPELADSSINPELADSPINPELADSPINPERADSPINPELADSPINPERADSPINLELVDSPIVPVLADSQSNSEPTGSPGSFKRSLSFKARETVICPSHTTDALICTVVDTHTTNCDVLNNSCLSNSLIQYEQLKESSIKDAKSLTQLESSPLIPSDSVECCVSNVSPLVSSCLEMSNPSDILEQQQTLYQNNVCNVSIPNVTAQSLSSSVPILLGVDEATYSQTCAPEPMEPFSTENNIPFIVDNGMLPVFQSKVNHASHNDAFIEFQSLQETFVSVVSSGKGSDGNNNNLVYIPSSDRKKGQTKRNVSLTMSPIFTLFSSECELKNESKIDEPCLEESNEPKVGFFGSFSSEFYSQMGLNYQGNYELGAQPDLYTDFETDLHQGPLLFPGSSVQNTSSCQPICNEMQAYPSLQNISTQNVPHNYYIGNEGLNFYSGNEEIELGTVSEPLNVCPENQSLSFAANNEQMRFYPAILPQFYPENVGNANSFLTGYPYLTDPSYETQISSVNSMPSTSGLLDYKNVQYQQNNTEELVNEKLSSMQLECNKEDLSEHEEANDMSKMTFNCTKCSFTTTKKCSLMSHVRVHKKTLKCKECHFVSNSIFEMRDHRLTHGRSYKCLRCDFTCFSSKSFNEHNLIHNKKFFSCPACPFKCKTKRQLLNHSSVHNKVVIKCNKCNYETNSEMFLHFHFKKHERDEIFLHCKLCNYIGSSKLNLETHLTTDHGQIEKTLVQCFYCDRIFDQEIELKQHIQESHNKN